MMGFSGSLAIAYPELLLVLSALVLLMVGAVSVNRAATLVSWLSIVALVGAAILAAQELRARLLRVAAHLLNAHAQHLDIVDGVIIDRIGGGTLTIQALARAQYSQMGRVPAEVREDLCVTRVYDPVVGTTSSATHLVQVEIDPQTYAVHLQRYVIAEDCGRVINPLIVEGQTRGALAQGVGAALFEEIVYDTDGQLLTANLVDYLIPTAPEMPNLESIHLPAVAPHTLGGFRGMGEGGTIGAPAAIANAVTDALAPLGIDILELPITPQRLFALIRDRRSATSRKERD